MSAEHNVERVNSSRFRWVDIPSVDDGLEEVFPATMCFLSKEYGGGQHAGATNGGARMSDGLRRLVLKPEVEEEEENEPTMDSHLPQPRTPRPALKKTPDVKPLPAIRSKWRMKRYFRDEDSHPTEFIGSLVSDFFILPAPLLDEYLNEVDDEKDTVDVEGGPTWRYCQAVKEYKRKRRDTAASWFDEEDFMNEYIDFKSEIRDRRAEASESRINGTYTGEEIPLWLSIREQSLKMMQSAHELYRNSCQLQKAFDTQHEQNHWDRVYVEELENDMDQVEEMYERKMKRVRYTHMTEQIKTTAKLCNLETELKEAKEELARLQEDPELTQKYDSPSPPTPSSPIMITPESEASSLIIRRRFRLREP